MPSREPETNQQLVQKMIADLTREYDNLENFEMRFEIGNQLQKWVALAQKYEKGAAFTERDLAALLRAIQTLPQEVQEQVLDAIAAELGEKFDPTTFGV